MSLEFDANELIYNKEPENNIYSGGYNISTLISSDKEINNVEDMFKDLVVPNLFFSSPMIDMGKYQKGGQTKHQNIHSNDLDDDLINKLLELAEINKKSINSMDDLMNELKTTEKENEPNESNEPNELNEPKKEKEEGLNAIINPDIEKHELDKKTLKTYKKIMKTKKKIMNTYDHKNTRNKKNNNRKK